MKLELPQEFLDVLITHIKKNYLKNAQVKDFASFNQKDFKYFSKGVEKLSQYFTSDRARLPQNYLNDPVLRSGYLSYFLPVNFLKFVQIITLSSQEKPILGRLRVLDLGSGPGTASLGLIEAYRHLNLKKKNEFEMTLIDQNFMILKDAQNLVKNYLEALGHDSKLVATRNYDFKRGGLSRFLRNIRYHYILLGNVLNEFQSREEQFQFVSQLITDHLDPKGQIILMEPALKKTSRDLQGLRDQVLDKFEGINVVAPCLHQEDCPLNHVNKRDWCHFYFNWKKNALIDKMDKLVGLNKDFLACSYLVLSEQEQRKWKQDEWRLISNNMRTKGKREVVLCGPSGRYHLERLDRDESPKNKDFTNARRGDLIQWRNPEEIDDFELDGVFRADKNTMIRKI